jgi:hypothetical protein
MLGETLRQGRAFNDARLRVPPVGNALVLGPYLTQAIYGGVSTLQMQAAFTSVQSTPGAAILVQFCKYNNAHNENFSWNMRPDI